MSGRYDTSGKPEDEHYLDTSVLINLEGIRGGNGRAIRFYFDVLSARTRGDLFDWTLTDEDEYLRACIAGFSQDYGLMINLPGRRAT